MAALDRALAALEAKDFESAARSAAEAVEEDPRDAQAYIVSAQAHLGQENARGAERIARSGLAALPGHPQLLLFLGIALYGQLRFEEALAPIDEVLAIHPALPPGHAL